MARYTPGHHRVFVPYAGARDGCEDDDEGLFRYSLVFALGTHASAVVDTAALTTPGTGAFAYPLGGVRAQELFSSLRLAQCMVLNACFVIDLSRPLDSSKVAPLHS